MKEELDYRGLVIKFLSGEITEGDMDVLKKWLEADPLNRRIFDEENELWQQSGIKAKVYDFNTDKAWTDLSAKLGIRKKK